ncbi:unnamed protein product [Leptosia nina]|uniref:Uncharacterized protein n=1 Tax=Leptosia nina TaxID=320188 RepID=A0AAV1J6Z1_9NEOP
MVETSDPLDASAAAPEAGSCGGAHNLEALATLNQVQAGFVLCSERRCGRILAHNIVLTASAVRTESLRLTTK